ncbi:MAG: hypothetical protein HY397_01295 [Candidatus Doudnabacteria bacterium]|nr:hypothetical protein [Candidatus Doudnabacteria bacterium]
MRPEPADPTGDQLAKLPNEVPETLITLAAQQHRDVQSIRELWGLIKSGKFNVIFRGGEHQRVKDQFINLALSSPDQQKAFLSSEAGHQFLTDKIGNAIALLSFANRDAGNQFLLDDSVSFDEAQELLSRLAELEEFAADFRAGHIEKEPDSDQFMEKVRQIEERRARLEKEKIGDDPQLVEAYAETYAVPDWLARVKLTPSERRIELINHLPVVQRYIASRLEDPRYYYALGRDDDDRLNFADEIDRFVRAIKRELG